MNCVYCGAESLVGEVTIKRMMPLAKRNGTIKVGGQAITQIDLKNSWALNADGSSKAVRAPIYCEDCLGEMHYVEGDKIPLKGGPPKEVPDLDPELELGSYEESGLETPDAEADE